jgi:hypothetical protein
MRVIWLNAIVNQKATQIIVIIITSIRETFSSIFIFLNHRYVKYIEIIINTNSFIGYQKLGQQVLKNKLIGSFGKL